MPRLDDFFWAYAEGAYPHLDTESANGWRHRRRAFFAGAEAMLTRLAEAMEDRSFTAEELEAELTAIRAEIEAARRNQSLAAIADDIEAAQRNRSERGAA